METDIQRAVAGDIPEVRELFVEYSKRLGIDLCFQGFDAELAELPGDYAPLRGALFIARSESGAASGCIALRPHDTTTGEIKRLYVRPAFRGAGLGARLAARVLESARAGGHDRLVLDTFDSTEAAVNLYGKLGFMPIPPYYDNPIPGVLYFELRIR